MLSSNSCSQLESLQVYYKPAKSTVVKGKSKQPLREKSTLGKNEKSLVCLDKKKQKKIQCITNNCHLPCQKSVFSLPKIKKKIQADMRFLVIAANYYFEGEVRSESKHQNLTLNQLTNHNTQSKNSKRQEETCKILTEQQAFCTFPSKEKKDKMKKNPHYKYRK